MFFIFIVWEKSFKNFTKFNLFEFIFIDIFMILILRKKINKDVLSFLIVLFIVLWLNFIEVRLLIVDIVVNFIDFYNLFKF